MAKASVVEVPIKLPKKGSRVAIAAGVKGFGGSRGSVAKTKKDGNVHVVLDKWPKDQPKPKFPKDDERANIVIVPVASLDIL